MAARRVSPFAHGSSEVWARKNVAAAIEREQADLGKRLRTIREAKEMTREEAAERAGIHAVHLARIEAGQANVTIATLVALSLAYRTPLISFFKK